MLHLERVFGLHFKEGKLQKVRTLVVPDLFELSEATLSQLK